MSTPLNILDSSKRFFSSFCSSSTVSKLSSDDSSGQSIQTFTYTAKDTARRQAIINDYDQEIEALYAAVDETAQTMIAPPASWSEEASITFVRTVVNRVLQQPVEDGMDIFQNGGDRYGTVCPIIYR